MMSYIFLLCAVPAVLSYTSGPPVANDGLCTDMIPDGHNGGVSLASDQDSPPYTITTTASEYGAGGSVMVTITGAGTNYIKGFFIQARRADSNLNNDVAIGTFSNVPANTKLLMCHSVANSAWGHSNTGSDRTSVSATWNAPPQDEGSLEFVATVVKGDPDRNYFYLHVKSAQLSFTAEAPPAGDGTNQPTTPSSGTTHVVSSPLATMFVMLAAFLVVGRH